MTRVNRPMIDHYLETLNAYLALSYPLRVDLAVWSPGDGWTRYQLITADGARTLSRVCTAREIYEVLYAACEILGNLHVAPAAEPIR